MTYLVAFLKFPHSSYEYCANLVRTDIAVGDDVLVRTRDDRYGPARVTLIEYLDWNCSAWVLCKMSETIGTPDGPRPAKPAFAVGLTTIWQMSKHLWSKGWHPAEGNRSLYKKVYGYNNGQDFARIMMRTHGIDFRIDPGARISQSAPEVYVPPRMGRHFLAGTGFNLYEGAARFADAFMANTGDYDRFFKPVGQKSWRPSHLIKRLPPRPERERKSQEPDLYGMLGGDGTGHVYLSDGLYLGPGNSWHDY